MVLLLVLTTSMATSSAPSTSARTSCSTREASCPLLSRSSTWSPLPPSAPMLSGPTAVLSPHSDTAICAMLVARWMSSAAPVDIWPQKYCSAARPPSRMASWARSSVSNISARSSFCGEYVKPRAPPLRGTMLMRSTIGRSGSSLHAAAPTMACPTSCLATTPLSFPCRMDRFFSTPAMVRSTALSKSARLTLCLLSRPASRAASFTRLARSAPVKPVVADAIVSTVTSSSSGRSRRFRCTVRICCRPILSGRSTATRRSKRPGRSSALSSTSARLVAAMQMTRFSLSLSKPSSSVSSWLSVCSRSSLPTERRRESRPLATASISSMNTIEGASLRALAKSSRTRMAPMPTYSSTNSLAEMEKKGTPASPAIALARSVLPVPGGPHSRTPLGGRAPRRAKRSGSRRNSTTSASSSLASSTPATSSNVTVVVGSCPLLP
mmetsp:Transcript_26857/g.69642  ORF Transcript_26857/g.69642 Transcript_26857/m.69642 type:complete len:438 (+) Transcript_26857:248-1561(+)